MKANFTVQGSAEDISSLDHSNIGVKIASNLTMVSSVEVEDTTNNKRDGT